MDDAQRYELGLARRREVLGTQHVDSAVSDGSSFSDVFQELATRYSWGEIWARDGLDRNTRSLIVIAQLVALNQPADLRLHVRSALRLGTDLKQIQEVLLQSAIYCGVVAADAAFRAVESVLQEEQEQE